MANDGGLPWEKRSGCGMILTPRRCGSWRRIAKTALKPGGYCRWQQSTTVRHALRLRDWQRRSADYPRLGIAVQRTRRGRAIGWQSAGPTLQTERGTAPGGRWHDREWPNHGGPW